ncbi:hypothetical protein Tco_1487254, partial [Tanacetum coccineum]
LDKESYHKLFDILKQHQNEVHEIHAEKLARNANLLALVAVAQHYPESKGKEVVKPVTPLSESASDEDKDEVTRSLGWPLEEIHVTWAHLEMKRTRLRTYTKSLKESCS